MGVQGRTFVVAERIDGFGVLNVTMGSLRSCHPEEYEVSSVWLMRASRCGPAGRVDGLDRACGCSLISGISCVRACLQPKAVFA